MREGRTIRIGAFARVAGVSVVTLRHYEEVGILQPRQIDPATGYRSYDLDQLPRLNRLLALRDLGFSLEQIRLLLAEPLSLERLQGMFLLQQVQTQQMLAQEQGRLLRIAARLHQIEQEGTLPKFDVSVKQVDELLVASVRDLIALDGGVGQNYGKVAAYLEQQHVPVRPPVIVLLHSRTQIQGTRLYLDVEVALSIVQPLPGNEEITIRSLPASEMACTIHMGMDMQIGQAYAALQRWMADNQYQVTGPARQIRLKYGPEVDPTHYITEVQYPIRAID